MRICLEHHQLKTSETLSSSKYMPDCKNTIWDFLVGAGTIIANKLTSLMLCIAFIWWECRNYPRRRTWRDFIELPEVILRNTPRPQQNGRHIQMTFSNVIFFVRKWLYFDSNFTEIWSQGPINSIIFLRILVEELPTSPNKVPNTLLSIVFVLLYVYWFPLLNICCV